MSARFATREDGERITFICSHQSVRPRTACDGAGEFSVEPWLRAPNLVVMVEEGCFLAAALDDRTYSIHTNLLPAGRGKGAIVSSIEALLLAFVSSPAEAFLTSVPSNNRPAAWLTRKMGFRETFVQPSRWKQWGQSWDLVHYRLDIDDWILQGGLIPLGKAFHEELEQRGHASHEEDLVHDAYVGFLCASLASGAVYKGLRVYNRWARASGYVAIKLLSLSPLTLDARDFLIKLDASGQFNLEMKEINHA